MKNHTSWSSFLWWLMLHLQASAMMWRAVKRMTFILDASPSFPPLMIATVFCISCFLYLYLTVWMIPISSGCKWLLQFGGKNVTLIFFRTMVSHGCAAHWSMKSKIFLFLALIWWSNCTKNSSTVDAVSHELEFTVYLVGFFHISGAVGFVVIASHSGSNFSVPSSLQPSRTVTLCFHFVSPWQESPLYVNVFLGWRL